MTVDQNSPHAVKFTQPSDLEFRVERTLDHPIERVWAAYTDPALIPSGGARARPSIASTSGPAVAGGSSPTPARTRRAP